jgi:oligoribonuclease
LYAAIIALTTFINVSQNDQLIQIACIITDGHLNIIEQGPDIVIHQDKTVMDNMDDWCKQHHGSSGLTAAVLASKTCVQDAEKQVLDFIKKHIPNQRVGVLAGNSVHVDKVRDKI